MAGKTFNGATVHVPIFEDKKSTSRFFHDTFVKNDKFSHEKILSIMHEELTKEELIFDITGATKEKDPVAFYIFDDIVENLLGNLGMANMRESITLKTTIDITKIFDTSERMDNFLWYFMKHTVDRKGDEIIPVKKVEKSFCVDFYWLLQIIEDYMVDELSGNRDDVHAYIYKRLTSWDGMFFLTMGVFKLNYRLLSVMVSSMAYRQSGSDKDIIKSFTDAIYQEENGKHLHFRQVAFSEISINKRLKDTKNTPFGALIYAKFMDVLKSDKSEQIAFGSDANTWLKGYEKEHGSKINIFHTF